MKNGAKLAGLSSALDVLGSFKEAFTTSDTYVVGTDVEYSIYVEFGTSNMRAQPYMRPAVETVMNNKADDILASASNLDEGLELLAHAIEDEAKRRCPVDTGNLRASIEVRTT